MSTVADTLESLTKRSLAHVAESNDLFWEAKMALGNDVEESHRKLAESELAYQEFYEDASWLKLLSGLKAETTHADEIRIIEAWQRAFDGSAIEDDAARKYSRTLLERQLEFNEQRGKFEWGYHDPETGAFTSATSNDIPNIISMHADERVRRSAYQNLLDFEQYVLTCGFLDLVRMRNELARMLGYEDYYAMSLVRNEGLTKEQVFSLLDDFERRTREHAERAMENFVREHGASSKEAWNYNFMRRGSLAKERDPYLPFEESVAWWVRSFSALGIRFRDAVLTLDLVDRTGKYENGFMHFCEPSFFDNGTWHPARINFCSHALPREIGAGERGLQVLFHEGGHAAHYANIAMDSPVYAHNPAPVSYPETQSMFCDRILHDADWQTRYAKMPFELIERSIRNDRPGYANNLRRTLMVCYFEKALYEMPDEERTPQGVIELARDVERWITNLNACPMPMLATTHPLDSPAYCHGYMLAEMAVYQTREYFKEKYGYIMDNPNVGRELAETYWAPGNSISYFEMIHNLTGKLFSADAFVREATKTVDEWLSEAKADIVRLAEIPVSTSTELNAHFRLIHGKEQIAQWSDGGFEKANSEFKTWVRKNYPKKV